MKNRHSAQIAIMLVGLLVTNCRNSNEKSENSKNNSIQTEKTVEQTKAVPKNLNNYFGVWSGPDKYPIVELKYKSGKIAIRECYGINPEYGSEYQGEYNNGKVIAIGDEKDFYKWTLPSFEFADENMDTIRFNSGIGPVVLIKTNESMPDIIYLPPKNND